jgi:hypothetical protein
MIPPIASYYALPLIAAGNTACILLHLKAWHNSIKAVKHQYPTTKLSKHLTL